MITLKADEVLKIAEAIATALGAGWSLKGGDVNGYPRASFENVGGYGIHMSGGMTIGEPFHFSGRLPQGGKWPSINCSCDKMPTQIAKDITRRLLPEYLPLYEQGVEQQNDTTARRDKAEKLAAELFEMFDDNEPMGVRLKPVDGNDEAAIDLSVDCGGGYIRVAATYCRFERFSPSPALAKIIVKAIADYAKVKA